MTGPTGAQLRDTAQAASAPATVAADGCSSTQSAGYRQALAAGRFACDADEAVSTSRFQQHLLRGLVFKLNCDL